MTPSSIREASVDTVHLVFKTHLDIGFTNLAGHVVDQYLHDFIPQAIALAREMRETGGEERFVWTVGSWLLYEALERTSGDSRKALEQAIASGDIVWHALPFTTHTEMMDASLFSFGLSLSQELDARFGRKTIAAKMTDVPGHTRAIVPLLVEAGVEFLHIGVNPASAMPQVPEVFRWLDEASGASVIVMYNEDYGWPTVAPGGRDALCVTSTGDNHGPHSPDAIRGVFQEYRARFPGAVVQVSTLDAFAATLRSAAPGLPIVTDEIGDTWIHGAGTDPAKVAAFRELSRLRRKWLTDGVAPEGLHLFSRRLLMVAEHTWGMDEKTHLNNYAAYRRPEFEAARSTAPFQTLESSWREQRRYIPEAIEALASELRQEAQTALELLKPKAPATHSQKSLSSELETPSFELRMGADGSVIHLRDKNSGKIFASVQKPLGLLSYQLFGSRDYDRFLNQYVRSYYLDRWTQHGEATWAILDFTKPGTETLLPDGKRWNATLTGLYHHPQIAAGFLLELGFPDEAVQHYGAPARLVIELSEPNNSRALNLRVQWFDKAACRFPEALWFSMTPPVTDWGRWSLDKMGHVISPYESVSKSARRLHAVERGVSYTRRDQTLTLRSWDAPLIALGEATLLQFDDRIASPSEGVHVNLYNNVWGTNFPMWYDDDALFRFRLEMG